MSKRMKRKKGFRKWFVALAIFGVIVLIGVAMIVLDGQGRRELQQMSISTVDFSRLQDGTYTGEYTGKANHSRDAKVEVTVTAGRVAEIRILKGALDNEGLPLKLQSGQTVYDLFGEVMRAQSLEVDAISGATLTSKAHLKALENALKQAQKPS